MVLSDSRGTMADQDVNMQATAGAGAGVGAGAAPEPVAMELEAELTYNCGGMFAPFPVVATHTLTSCFRSHAACGASNTIRGRDPVQCRNCGGRILYKARTTRSTWVFRSACTLTTLHTHLPLHTVIQFEAR